MRCLPAPSTTWLLVSRSPSALIPLAGFVALFYLPGVDGFPLLCLGLGVPLFFAALFRERETAKAAEVPQGA